MQPLERLRSLNPNRGTTCLYMNYGPGSASKLAYRSTEYNPLKLHIWFLRGSRGEIVQQNKGDRKDPCGKTGVSNM
jgi:hypothetical protein